MLNKKINEELNHYGKAEKMLTDHDFCKMKENNSQVEEVPINSSLYNKALL